MTDPIWQKSSFSGADDSPNCVELATADGKIMMRESADPETIIATSPERLRSLLFRVKAGDLDHLI
ncbi:DUF397 domain-containing protein [Streptomyces corynorhini]|uniref:DUF397 domain-containing protein n=1 Tax=Streptomyces corynorhini TaxID=2282652 RepID=A0A370BB83_9ACTN|nr:DUF397 domain-containing protein [Streptomyces corynorhini]RDG39048.1 DUF397 domain-containing protein [Streptomyces corynorhini]